MNGQPASRHRWVEPERYRVRYCSPLSGQLVFRYFGSYEQARDFALTRTLPNGCPCEVEGKPGSM